MVPREKKGEEAMSNSYYTQRASHPILDRDEYYRDRFSYERDCEREDECEEDSDEYNENGYASAEDYWNDRI